MSLETAVKQFSHQTLRGFRFERFYENGKKMWQASCQFDVKVELDPALEPVDKGSIEYRQFIRGGVWVRRGREAWTSDSNPNGNAKFHIPPYGGQSSLSGIPGTAVPGNGLSLQWKEDGQIESGHIERYGYRETATVDASHEKDIWKPDNYTGSSYQLRDTPSIRGEWGIGESVEVWIELYFMGFVVQIEQQDNGSTRPVKLLKKNEWNYLWTDKKLSEWMSATPV